MNPRESVTVDSDGRVVVNKTVDAEPIMDAIRAYGDFIDRYSTAKRAQKMVGSIDPVTATLWSREWGCRVGTKEFAKLAVKRIKDDLNFRKFRVGW